MFRSESKIFICVYTNQYINIFKSNYGACPSSQGARYCFVIYLLDVLSGFSTLAAQVRIKIFIIAARRMSAASEPASFYQSERCRIYGIHFLIQLYKRYFVMIVINKISFNNLL